MAGPAVSAPASGGIMGPVAGDGNKNNQRRDRWPFDLGGGGGSNQGPQADRNRRIRVTLWVALILLAVFVVLPKFVNSGQSEIPFSRFVSAVERGPRAFSGVVYVS